MTVRDRKGDISKHKADALLFAGPSDCEPDQLEALHKRYPELRTQHQAFSEKAKGGQMKPMDLEGGRVILLFLSKGTEYLEIRQAFEKLVGNAKRLKVSSLACVPIGKGSSKNIHPDAIELIAKGVVADSPVAIDVYTEHAE